jgi:hypothetical protein
VSTAVDQKSRGGKSPYRWFIIAVIVVVAAVLGIGFALAGYQGDFAPKDYVLVTNNTDHFVNWSCSSSNLHLAVGSTGRLRIPGKDGEDFACVTGSGTNEIDTCPDLSAADSGKRFTVTGWTRQFACP